MDRETGELISLPLFLESTVKALSRYDDPH
jgi:hypothetical protein